MRRLLAVLSFLILFSPPLLATDAVSRSVVTAAKPASGPPAAPPLSSDRTVLDPYVGLVGGGQFGYRYGLGVYPADWAYRGKWMQARIGISFDVSTTTRQDTYALTVHMPFGFGRRQ